MENNEQSLIAHLLEVEEKASELITQAQQESEAQIAQARAKADAEYNEKYKAMSAALEDEYNKKIQEFDAQHTVALETYKNEVLQTTKDIDAFDKYLQQVL